MTHHQPVYRIRTSDGASYEVQLQPKQIGERYPGARITHKIKFDGEGRGVPIPYQGNQPESPEREEDNAPENAPTTQNTGGQGDEDAKEPQIPANGKEPAKTAENERAPKRGK